VSLQYQKFVRQPCQSHWQQATNNYNGGVASGDMFVPMVVTIYWSLTPRVYDVAGPSSGGRMQSCCQLFILTPNVGAWSRKLVAVRAHGSKPATKRILRRFNGKTEELATRLAANAVSNRTALSTDWRDHQIATTMYFYVNPPIYSKVTGVADMQTWYHKPVFPYLRKDDCEKKFKDWEFPYAEPPSQLQGRK
jgi:hypothetical protein